MLGKWCTCPSFYAKPTSTHPALTARTGQGHCAQEERQEAGPRLSISRGAEAGSASQSTCQVLLFAPCCGSNEGQCGCSSCGHCRLSLNLQSFLSSYTEIRFNVKPTPIFFFFKAKCAKSQEKQKQNNRDPESGSLSSSLDTYKKSIPSLPWSLL